MGAKSVIVYSMAQWSHNGQFVDKQRSLFGQTMVTFWENNGHFFDNGCQEERERDRERVEGQK